MWANILTIYYTILLVYNFYRDASDEAQELSIVLSIWGCVLGILLINILEMVI